MNRLGLLLLLAAVACSSAQPSAQEPMAPQGGTPQASAPASGPKFYRDGLSGVDFSGMDAVAKERALQILNANRCDCGCGMTIAQCRVEDKTCPRSPGLAAAVVNAIKAGKTDQQAVADLKAMQPAQAAPAAGGAAAPAPPVQPVPKVEIDTAGSPSMGPDGAKVVVVAFEDFQCPFCSRAAPVLKQLLGLYPKDVRVVYKHYPLNFHPQAKPAAIASIAAQRQNKFWEMHDLLYQNQKALDPASLRRYAESLGLDMAAYDKAIADPEIARLVEKETMDAQKANVGGTPSFYVNGVASPAWDVNTMKRLIDVAVAGGDVSMEAGKIRSEQMAAQQRARANQPPPPDPNKVHEIDTTGNPSKGAAGATVTIVEFSDYQ